MITSRKGTNVSYIIRIVTAKTCQLHFMSGSPPRNQDENSAKIGFAG
jgi:hypothetical protein